MTFEVLQKSPEVAPLLVRLYDTHNLYSLAENKESDEACFELTAIMVDLLNVRLSERESELITDVLLALMKQAEKDLKIALSERLSTMGNVPLRMVLGLANEEISVADSVLRNSPVLHDMDLAYILQAKGVEHGRSIAMRHGLSASMIDMLADTKDFQIAVNLSKNDGVTLTEHAYRIFIEMAKISETLARPLSIREDLPKEFAEKLYAFVSEGIKEELRERFHMVAEKAIETLDDIMIEMRDHVEDSTQSLLAHAHNQQRRGELKIASVIATLRRGQYSTFLAQFAVFTGLPADTVKAMLRQDTGKGLATTCRAMDIPKAEFVSLYLLTERFRSPGKKMVNHNELTRIMTMYDSIDRDEARRVLNNSRN